MSQLSLQTLGSWIYTTSTDMRMLLTLVASGICTQYNTVFRTGLVWLQLCERKILMACACVQPTFMVLFWQQELRNHITGSSAQWIWRCWSARQAGISHYWLPFEA